MNDLSRLSRHRLSTFSQGGGPARPRGFSLVELLVVIGIMAILAAIASPLVPSLLRGNQMDSGVNTLSGVLEEAREAATANNTFIWVAFTAPVASSNSSALSTWVATIQSQDGTETGINTGTSAAPVWATPITVPGTNLLLHSKLQNLPGVAIVQLSKLPSTLTSPTNTNVPASAYDLVLTEGTLNLKWTISTSGSAGLASTVTFGYAIEFTPNGEAHVPTWNANTQFGLSPTVGKTTNSALFNISRLTGKATVYRM